MSQEELVQAYLQGNVSRRTFIRRLVAMGITLSAAVAYTHALRPALARADHIPDHYEAPAVITTDASDLAGENARLNADVDPNRFPTKVWFEFGTTTSYGVKTSEVTISGNGFQPVGAAVIGLDPGRVYHFRVVASNQIGQTTGADRALAIPDATLPQTGISRLDTDIDSVQKAGVLRVLVSSDEAVQLSLEATMQGSKKKPGGLSSRGKAKRIVAARGELTLDAAGDRVAELPLTRAGRRALKKVTRTKLSLRVEATDLAGNTSVSRLGLLLS